MRPDFDPQLLSKLQTGETKEVFGSPVFIKPIPDDSRPGVLDPREFALAKKTLEQRKAIPLTLENVRKEEGFPNIDQTTVEITTKTIPLEREGISFSLCMFAPKALLDKKNQKALLFVHGGSYVSGSVKENANPLKYLAQIAECVVFSLEYSLAPEYPFPCALEETKESIEYLKGHAVELGIDPNQIYLGGDSAGANLALGACESYRPSDFKGLVLFYPVVALNFDSLPFAWKETDFEMDPEYKPYILPRLVLGRSDGKIDPFAMLISAFYLRHGESRSDKRASPLYHTGSLFPKMILFTAEFDGLRQQGEYFAAKVNKEGGQCKCIRYKGVHHAFLNKFGHFPQADDAILEVASFMKE